MGTKFIKENFTTNGDRLEYEGRFVARFKHRGSITPRRFRDVLIKRYEVEDYFLKLERGEAPFQILMTDGILIRNGGWFYLNGKKLG